MFRAVALVMVPLALIYWFFSNDIGDHPVEPVNQDTVLTQAAEEAPFQVMAPAGLPSDRWVPNRASWVGKGEPDLNGEPMSGGQLDLGYVSPEDIYFGVRQTDVDQGLTIRDLSREGRPQGTEDIDGETWERWRSPDGRTGVLVTTTDDGSTLAVAADADFTQLSQFARLIEPWTAE